MSLQGVLEGAGFGVPDLDCAVGASGGDPASIGGELDHADGFLVAAQYKGGFVVQLVWFGRGRGGAGRARAATGG